MLPSFIHLSAAAPFRERTNHMFQGGILNGHHPRPKYLQLSCPLASLSSTLSLRTGLDGLCWNTALLFEQDGCRRTRSRERRWGTGRYGTDVISCLHVKGVLRWQERGCLWRVGKERGIGDGMSWSMVRRGAISLVCVYLMCIWMSKYVFFCFVLWVCTNFQCVFVHVGLLGMRLEKYRVFYVVFALCFTVSLVGGWLTESFGQRLRYQEQRFGSGGGGSWRGADKREGKPTCTCGFWIPSAHYCTVMYVSLPLPTTCSAERIRCTTEGRD